jgi:hypothetical protein
MATKAPRKLAVKEAVNTIRFEVGCDILHPASKTPPDRTALEFLFSQPEILRAKRNGDTIAKLLVKGSFTSEQDALKLMAVLGEDIFKIRDRKRFTLAEDLMRRFPAAMVGTTISKLLRNGDSSKQPVQQKAENWDKFP